MSGLVLGGFVLVELLVLVGLDQSRLQDAGVLDGLDIYVERVENTRILKARLVETDEYEQSDEDEAAEDEA